MTESHPIINLWFLRVLRVALELAWEGRPPPRRNGGGLDHFHGGLQETGGSRHDRLNEKVYGVARGVADYLGESFDPDASRAILNLSMKLRRKTSSLERSIGERHPLECLEPVSASNVDSMGQFLGLSLDEKLVLTVLLMINSESKVSAACHLLGHDLDDKAADSVISKISGLSPGAVSRVLSPKGTLISSQLIRRDRNPQFLVGKYEFPSHRFVSAMREPEFNPLEALKDRIVKAQDPKLRWEQFAHLGDLHGLTLAYCRQALVNHTRGANLLIHGPNGCGKSEAVRALARELDCELWEVPAEDSDGDPISGSARLTGLRIAQQFTARRKAIVVLDELEDVLMRIPPSIGGPNRTGTVKAWFHKVLESNPVPTVFVTNSIEQLDPAWIRRMAIVIEMKAPPAHVREAQFHALPGNLALETIHRLSAHEHVTPGIAARAAEVAASVATAMPSLNVSRHVELLVNSTLKAQGHASLKPLSKPQVYDPRMINCDADPVALIDGLRKSRAGRLLFAGESGAGKSALAAHIARELGANLIERRCSDILGPYVGESERAIAAAFADAEAAGAVLLIDEIDSLLFPRSHAQRSHEITRTNEMLVCVEKFSGIFIASTNHLIGLDGAILRRFDLKVSFGFLRPEQSVALLAAHLHAAGLHAAEPFEEARLRALAVLTPGDFAAVARQSQFRRLATAAEWVSALEAECRHKQCQPRAPIGFGRPA